MKRLLPTLLLCFFASNAIADYASHQFHYMEMELSKCKSIASDAAIKNGFSNPQSQDVAFAGGSYAIVFSTNKEGYSFQYTCEPKKGFGYLIITGPRVDKKNSLRDSMGEEIQNMANKAK